MQKNLNAKENGYIQKIKIQTTKKENIIRRNIVDREGKKRCETCKEIKHISKFYKRINKKHEIHCKNCRNKQRDENHRYWKQQFIYKLSEYIELECVTCGYNKNFSQGK